MSGAPLWIVLALGLLAFAGLATWVVLRRRASRRRARRAGGGRLRHPVVLAHGILGFDELKLAGARAEYFRGVADRLRHAGADVHVLRVSPLRSVAERAEELARAVKSIDAKQVNVIAHSMGGLDARYAISQLGLAAKVASLTTIGTPHQGTPLADIGASVGDKLGLRRLLQKLGLDVAAFYDLTTHRMEAFNRSVGDAKRVFYGSYSGAARTLALNPMLMPAHLYLSQKMGPNDGLVPVSSQVWGERLGTIEADHWAQIGWSVTFDAPEFYARVAEELRKTGF